jgi:hypothetical protein
VSPNEHRTPLNPEFIKRYSQGRLVLDFPALRLQQRRAAKPAVYVGKGLLEVVTDGEFKLRLYVESSEHHEHPFVKLARDFNETKPGDFIPDERYFLMSGHDINGFEWQCARVQADVQDAGHGIVVTGVLQDVLKHEVVGLSEAIHPRAAMYFFSELRVALGRPGVPHATATFGAAGFEFTVTQVAAEEGGLVMLLRSSQAAMPATIETRVEEALRYVTASSANWCIVEKRYGTRREVMVVPRRPVHKSFFYEPVDHRHPDMKRHYWHLFARYVEHVLTADEPEAYHPLSSQLFHVFSGETRQLDLNGLVVGVAVEGILNVAFSDIGKPAPEFLAAREALAHRVDKVRCKVPELERRVKGALDAMKSSTASATDKLKALEAAGVVTRESVKQWKDLRNKTAHAKGSYDPTALTKLYPLCNAVYTMLNRLVFQAIGYEGDFQDFSRRGWPKASFKPASYGPAVVNSAADEPSVKGAAPDGSVQ